MFYWNEKNKIAFVLIKWPNISQSYQWNCYYITYAITFWVNILKKYVCQDLDAKLFLWQLLYVSFNDKVPWWYLFSKHNTINADINTKVGYNSSKNFTFVFNQPNLPLVNPKRLGLGICGLEHVMIITCNLYFRRHWCS